jgi:hypothetical protein
MTFILSKYYLDYPKAGLVANRCENEIKLSLPRGTIY